MILALTTFPAEENSDARSESLVGLKDAAYQKLMDANEALASAREGVWEATHSAWDAAHDT
jgi:hypothetical protein